MFLAAQIQDGARLMAILIFLSRLTLLSLLQITWLVITVHFKIGISFALLCVEKLTEIFIK